MKRSNSFFLMGTQKSNAPFLNRKIILSNQITSCLILVAALYSLFSLIYYPSIAFVPVSGILLCGLTFLLNYLRVSYASRVIISLTPEMVAVAFHAYLCRQGASPIVGLYLLQMAFALTPFMLIDIREKKTLLFLSALCAMMIVFFDNINFWLQAPLNDSLLRQGMYANGSIVLSLVVAYSYFSVLGVFNYNDGKESEALHKIMQESNEKLFGEGKIIREGIEKIENVASVEKHISWEREGISSLSEGLQRERDIQMVGDRVVSFIASYLQVNQAAIYLVKGLEEIEQGKDTSITMADKGYISLLSMYGYGRKKYMEKTISLGQGVLGQACLEKQEIYLQNLPSAFCSVTSGRGTPGPTCLLCVPLILSGGLEGMLEIASFSPLSSQQLSFAREAAETMAAHLYSLRMVDKTQMLLEQTQAMTEQMQSQEQELQQNMDEIQAANEEVIRTEAELQARIKELEKELQAIEGSTSIG